jgi:uncharacterized protein (TIGR00290 family)
MKRKALLSWSSGKDSAWALHVLRQDLRVEVVGLFSTINERYQRVAMHATRVELLQRQSGAVGLPFQTISLPDPCTNEQCDTIMRSFVEECAGPGIDCMAFGDLFLTDIRAYRENQLRETGIQPVFPLWGIPTGELAERMLSAGVEAYVSSVDLKRLPVRVAGRRWTRQLLAEFPPEIDPCGENGEIHTVIVNGPMFSHSIPVQVGQIVERDGFAYADIIPIS